MISVEKIVLMKNILAFVSAFFLGQLVLMYILANYLSKAKYPDMDDDYISVEEDRPSRFVLSLKSKSFLAIFDVFVSIIKYHMFFRKITPRKIIPERGRKTLVTSIVILALLLSFVTYQAMRIKSEIQKDLNPVTIQELEDMGLDQDSILKIIEDGRINIKEE